MKIYVPRFQHHLPITTTGNPCILADMLVQVDGRDLRNIIETWRLADNYTGQSDPCVLTRSLKDVCKYPVRPVTIGKAPFLWRPSITAHGGAREGAGHCKAALKRVAIRTGVYLAKAGYNLMMGGAGPTGVMHDVNEGYQRQLKKKRFPNQFSIQIVPSEFVFGVRAVNGNRPKNEGLSKDFDVTVVLPSFAVRREMLDSYCVAAVTAPGGTGTLDEFSDVLVHAKTGQRPTKAYVLNTHIKKMGCGYYDPLITMLQGFVDCGQASPNDLECFTVVKTPGAFAKALRRDLPDPHGVYRANVRHYAPR